MSAGRSLFLRCAAIVLAQLCAPAYAQAQSLRHDVFARPALSSMQPLRIEPDPGSQPEALKPVWNPVLRAVIAAGRESLANVDGAIVRIGGKIDGYRLVEVRERDAIFVKDKQRYTLTLGAIKGAGAAREAPAISTDKAPAAAPPAQDTDGAQSPAAKPETQITNDRQGLDTKRRSP